MNLSKMHGPGEGMKLLSPLLLALFVIHLSSLSATADEQIDYAKHDPLQVLDILAKTPSDWVHLADAPDGWIRKEHIPKLLEKLALKKRSGFQFPILATFHSLCLLASKGSTLRYIDRNMRACIGEFDPYLWLLNSKS